MHDRSTIDGDPDGGRTARVSRARNRLLLTSFAATLSFVAIQLIADRLPLGWLMATLTLLAVPVVLTVLDYRRAVLALMRQAATPHGPARTAVRIDPLEPVVYRHRRSLRLYIIVAWVWLAVVALIVLGGVSVAVDPEATNPPGTPELVIWAAFGVFPWLLYVRLRRRRLVAAHDGLTMISSVRTRMVPWGRIRSAFVDGAGLTLLLDNEKVVRTELDARDPEARQFVDLIAAKTGQR